MISTFLVTPTQNEIVNVNHIVAVKTITSNKKILIYTTTGVVAIRTNTEDELDSYEEQIEIAVHAAAPRWVKCQNWLFRADKIVHVSKNNDGLSVAMDDEKMFKVIKIDPADPVDVMEEFTKALSRPLMADKGPNLVVIK